MADSDSSPSSPRFSCCPWQGLETNRGVGGEGHGLGLHVVLIRPISTRETAAAYTRLLGCDLNSKFFLYKFKWNQRLKQRESYVIIG
jgi:hypothetical protein